MATAIAYLGRGIQEESLMVAKRRFFNTSNLIQTLPSLFCWLALHSDYCTSVRF